MTSSTTTPETTVDPKKALIQKGVILVSAAAGLILSIGVSLPGSRFHKSDSFENDTVPETETDLPS